MAWITPVIDRTDGARMVADDANRIVGDIQYVYPAATFAKTSYGAEYLTAANMTEIVNNTHLACQYYGVNSLHIYNLQTYDNMNEIENCIRRCKLKYDLLVLQALATLYCGDDIYIGDDQYIRGH